MARRERSNLWRPAVLAAVLAICLFALYQGTVKLRQAQEQLDMVTMTNQKLARDNQRLYRQVQRLRRNPQALERTARREMGMAAPNEVVYQATGAGGPARPGKKE